MTMYRIVQCLEGKLVESHTTNILDWMAVRGFRQIGRNSNLAQHEALHGEPRFADFVGPMFDGDAVRYEDSRANEMLSI